MNFTPLRPAGSRHDHNARLAERAILGGATAKRSVSRPVSLRFPIRRADPAPIRCIQTQGMGKGRPLPGPREPLADRMARGVMSWFWRLLAAVLAFVLMTAAPGWIENAFALGQPAWGF